MQNKCITSNYIGNPSVSLYSQKPLTWLYGMFINVDGTKIGTCPLHMRLDGDDQPEYSGVCSCTGVLAPTELS